MCAISMNSCGWDSSELEGKLPKPAPSPRKRLWLQFFSQGEISKMTELTFAQSACFDNVTAIEQLNYILSLTKMSNKLHFRTNESFGRSIGTLNLATSRPERAK